MTTTADLALTYVDARCPEGDETVDLRLLATVCRWPRPALPQAGRW
jgi:hypothetical protein